MNARSASSIARVALGCALAGAVFAASPASAGTGTIVYSDSTTATVPVHKLYNGSAFVAGATMPTGAARTFVVDRAARTRNEHIAGYVTTGGVLYVVRWNGTGWSAEWNVTVGGAGVNGRRFDIAYEYANDRAIVVYSNNTAGTNELRYRIYDPATGWGGALNLDVVRTTGTPNAIKLAARQFAGSNAIAMAAADTTGDLTALVWDGSSWAASTEPSAVLTATLQQTAAAGDKDSFDVAYENLSGDLMVVYSTTTPTNLYATRVGTTWTTNQTLSATGRTIQSMFAVADRDQASNQIVIGWDRTASASRYAVIWSGTALGTLSTVGTNADATAPPATSHQMTGAWLTSGSSKRAVVVYQSTTATNIDYAYFDVTAGTWTNTQASTGYTSGAKRWVDMNVDPMSPDTLMLTYSDASSDVWAKRLVYNGSTLTWSNADGGAAIGANLQSIATQNYSFAHDQYVRKTTIATGTDPTGLPPYVAPGSAAQVVDDFTVQTDNGTDSITAVQVTLATGTWQGVGLVEITDETGATVYGSAAPTADANNITLSSAITSSMTLTHYRIRITPAAATAMPAPQGSVLNVTARITDITVTNSKDVNDSASATLVIDNASSPNVTGATATGGVATVTANWTNPGAGAAPGTDFSGTVLVLGNDTQAVAGSPTEGVTSYIVGDPVGSDTVVCFGAITSCQKTGLGSADAYYFEIFTLDGVGNWSNGVATSGTSSTVPVTTIGTGTDPTIAATWVAPGTGAVVVDAFTVQKSASPVTGDTITAVEVTFATGTAQGISLVEIINNAENTLYGSAPNPSDVQSIALTTNIPSTTTSTQYKIRVTPKSHANMAVPQGGAYSVTARISDITVTYAKSLGDTVGPSATLNIDNQSSANVTGASASASSNSVTASWTNPAAGSPPDDFASVIVVGSTASISGAPTEGQTVYGVGNTVGTGTVVCVDPAGQSCTQSPLGAGQVYHMKIFTRDAFGNWSTGVGVAATVPDNRTTAGAFNASLVDCGHVSLQANYTGDYDDDNTVTFARGTSASGPFNTTVCSSVGGGTNPRTCTDTTNLTAGSTFYYQATFTDPDNTPTTIAVVSGAVAIPSGCTPVPPGNTAGANIPVLSIINPSTGAVIGSAAGGFRAQVRVFSRDASAIAGLNLSTDGSNPSCTAASLNGFSLTAHVAGNNAWVYEKTITLASSGTYLLRACARNGAGEARSEAVTIRYNSALAGDGNLIVRDNASQLCNDCHGVKSHSSESTSSTYGSWSTTCRDCHQPHSTRNLKLVAEQINTPTVDTYLGPVAVEFRDKDTGDSGTSETISFVTSDATKLAAGRRGPCQACHTRTLSRAQMTGGTFTPSSTSVTASGTFVSGDVGKYILGPDGKSYQITAFVSGTQVTISPAYAGSTPVSNYTFQWGLRRWRNAGNADGHYTAAASTSMCTTCHSHTEGFGSTTICLSCHGTTGGDVNELAEGFWQSNTMAKVDRDQWTYSGHGRTSGTYDVTGNVAPAFSTSPAPGFTECLFCHSDTVAHRDGANPFRLRGASTDATGNTGTYNPASAPNSTCLNCHQTSSFGVNNGGGVKNGGVKVEESHNGTKHTSGTLGGKFCWDCHEPHGDRTASGGNIAMIRAKVLAVTDGTYGYLGASGVERTVTYNDQAATGPAVGRAVEKTATDGTEHVGLCQACHGHSTETYWTKYWNHLGYDDVDGNGGSAPTSSGHQRVTSVTPNTPYCIACHKHSLKFAPDGTCTTCHDQTQTITMGSLGASGTETRRDVVTEFSYTWSHKRNSTPTARTVTNNDCGVCHMEGSASTGIYQAPHGDGLINLRDPDTGANIRRVEWTGSGAGAYTEKVPAEDAVFARFGRNLGSNDITLDPDVASIQIRHCLRCHDSNGAAAVDGSPLVPGGSPGKPFATTIAAGQGNYAGGNGFTACATGTDGCVTNIDASFTTTNSSYHPIKGKQNNSYVTSTRMNAPWNTIVKTPANTTSWGYLISCWDCHAPTGASGPQTTTVTAHGGTATVRSDTWSTTSGLCKTCHIAYVAGGSTTSHGLGSAFNSNTNSGMSTYIQNQCHYCHSSGVTKSPRPQPAEDVHGFDAFGLHMGTDNLWPVGTSETHRPYSFMRSVGATYSGRWTASGQLWRPASTPELATGTATCGGNMSATSCSDSMTSYTPGGVY
jgi:hypothetical protein